MKPYRIKYKRLWKMAREEQALARAAYPLDMMDVHSAVCKRRDLLIEMIARHPKCIYTKLAVMCQIIDGLSGNERELKVEIRR